jgi:hypothetical protein
MRSRAGLAGAAIALATTLGPAPGALAQDAVYGGSTSGRQPIVVTADPAAKKLRGAVIAWKAKCADGMSFPDASSLTVATASPGFSPSGDQLVVKRNAKRRFSGTQSVGYDLGDSAAAVTVALDGKLGAKSASGTLTAHVAIVDKASGNPVTTCDQPRTHWSASRAPGRVYAGRTSEEQPVVVRVDAKRKHVTDMLVSWSSASCQPDGFVQYPEDFTNFPVAAGRFGDKWDDTEKSSDGGSVKVDYDVAGRVARRAVRGTLRVGVTWMDPAGAPTSSCDSGGVTWKATTG